MDTLHQNIAVASYEEGKPLDTPTQDLIMFTPKPAANRDDGAIGKVTSILKKVDKRLHQKALRNTIIETPTRTKKVTIIGVTKPGSAPPVAADTSSVNELSGVKREEREEVHLRGKG